MLRHFFKSLEPLTNKLTRTISGVGSSGNGAGAAVSPFERNCETKEQQLSAALKKTLPGITYISVEDISGGCGAMFEISVEAKEFIGLSTVKQHRLVTDSLKKEIAEMHGIRIHTSPSKTK
ncbi:bolA-like protein 3 isoform X1 [Galleria mellonella]|uniref:BolA-like protein 3 isoform X1 n=1 Tax=Galleria mellonella TaxID=7137 RepID=A0A6J1W6S3_GALME|nr:bolA-like protein 3 isoform X1 [Galleria mellonella]